MKYAHLPSRIGFASAMCRITTPISVLEARSQLSYMDGSRGQKKKATYAPYVENNLTPCSTSISPISTLSAAPPML